MALSIARNYHLCLSFSVMAIIFFSLTFLPPHESGGGIESSSSSSSNINGEELRKMMVLGSRPPGCLNKCMSCRPCDATLVIPSHQDSIKQHTSSSSSSSSNYQKSLFLIRDHQDDTSSYYLLSWKCSCGNKLYQP